LKIQGLREVFYYFFKKHKMVGKILDKPFIFNGFNDIIKIKNGLNPVVEP